MVGNTDEIKATQICGAKVPIKRCEAVCSSRRCCNNFISFIFYDIFQLRVASSSGGAVRIIIGW